MTDATKDSATELVTVELRVFSGRPNPRWELATDEAKHLTKLVDESRGKEEANPPPEGGLGYSGFALWRGSARGEEPPVVVYRGVISEGARARAKHWSDNSGIEEWLIEHARSRGHGDVLDHNEVKPFRRARRSPP
jgi:hypothetical protein